MNAPEDEAGIARAVAEAAQAGQMLKIGGYGSKSGMLRSPHGEPLSTRAYSGITLYEPGELVLSARAGTSLAEIEHTVAARGQHLPAEPPDWRGWMGSDAPQQSIGGIVAANLSGPRRIMSGATRDHVLGVRLVNGLGEVLRSGGRVLKNVTGLDLCKLMTGSHGTLGVLTEITWKVLPKPERTGSVLLPGLQADAALRALSAGLGSPFGISAACWLPADHAAQIPALAGFGASVTLMRIEDFASSVAYRLAQMQTLLAGFGAPVLLDHEQSVAAWRAVRNAETLRPDEGDAVWRVSVRPSRGPGVLRALAPEAHGFLDWGGGLVWLTGAGNTALHQRVTRAATEAGGTWTLMRAPDALRQSADVIPPEPEAMARIAGRVKHAMDPHNVFNPGRLYAAL